MNGELGSLVQGKQIGGFYNWTIELKFITIDKPFREYNKAPTKATAESFWMLSEPSQEEIRASYYQLIQDRLVLVSEAVIKAEFGLYELNKLINRELEMTWMT